MKKVFIIVTILLIFIFGVVFGTSWAQNSWITSAVNKGLKESGQLENTETAARLDGLKSCELEEIRSTELGKEGYVNCFNSKKELVSLKATATKDGKILVFQKYKFTGITIQ